MFSTTIPAGPPPSGLASNFTNTQDHGKRFAAVAVTFLSLAVFIVSLRVYTQLTLLKRINIDDCKYFGSDSVGRLNRISGRRHGPGHCMSLDLYQDVQQFGQEMRAYFFDSCYLSQLVGLC